MDARPHSPEDKRLAALAGYDMMDTPAEASFDRITRITQTALDAPMASISLIDGHRQWLKSRQGGLARQAPRCHSFCSVAIRQSEPLVIEDATADERFKDNPLVTGAPFIRSYAGVQLQTPDGFNLGALCVIDTKPRRFDDAHIALLRDLAAMVMEAFEAQKLARTDSLTGALTRRAFREEAERALALARRYRHSLSAVAFDLDRLKAINDAHGRAVGDRVLVATVAACNARLRASDILGRVGGEEFAIILPHTNVAGALNAAEEMRGLIARQASDGIAVTASFGIAALERTAAPLDELLRRAGAALHEAKNAGCNRCVASKAPRQPTIMRRVFKAGQIVFNAGRSAIDCTVRGIGIHSASVDVVSTASVPETFKLAIVGDGFSRACTITTKSERHLEVAFC
jgi:diguanylate cyclase (GGDEF)-like protein